MNRIFRAVLENDSAPDTAQDQAMVVMKGPLADVYAQALDVALAKDESAIQNASTQVQAVLESFKLKSTAALESAQMDTALLQGVAAAAAADEESPPVELYAVAKTDLDNDVVVEVTAEASKQAANNNDFILIIDATQPGTSTDGSVPTENYVQLGSALESMVQAMGGKVYSSLGQFAAARLKR